MVERTRLTDEQREQNNQNIAKISELTAQIKEILPNLNGKACNEAFNNSVINLETKIEKYTTKESFRVSNEEKELLRKIRAGEAQVSPVSSDVEEQVSSGKRRKGN